MEPRAHLGFRVLNVNSDVADIDIFDVIGDPWEGTTAKDFIAQLREVTAPNINLHINSPGGYVTDGLAMYSALQQHPATITAYVEGQAASAASFVAMAAEKIVIAKHASMMIHDASGFGIGNASDFRALVDILEEQSQNIADIYAERTGDTAEDWRKRMQANNGIGSSYRGQEAVDIGLADEVMATPKKGLRDLEPMRAIAQVDPEPIEQTEPALDLVSAMRSAVLEKPAPTIEALLGVHPLKEAVSAGMSSNGGKHA